VSRNLLFRSWFYFRTGWQTYFAFILAAINTLTVTYFLAIENYPSLKTVFPSFETYILITISIGVPLLVLIGYVHFKRSHSFKSEADVLIESNPYQRRNTVNSEIILRLNLQLMSTLLKVAKKEDLSEEEIEEITQLHDEILKLSKDRTLTDNIDMNFLKKEIVKL
jgi:amino acid permease